MLTYKSYITPTQETNLKLYFIVEQGILETGVLETYTFTHTNPVSAITDKPTFESVYKDTSLNNNKLIWEYQHSTDNILFSSWKNVEDTDAFTETLAYNNYYKFKVTLPEIETEEKYIVESISLNGLKDASVENNYVFVLPAGLPSKYYIFKPDFVFKVFFLNDLIIDVDNPTYLSSYFRYSNTNGRKWSNWFILNKDNLKAINFNPLDFVRFEFSFLNTSNSVDVTVQDITLIGNYQNITLNYTKSNKLGLKEVCFPSDDDPSNGGDGGDGSVSSSDNTNCNNTTNMFNIKCSTGEGTFDPYSLGQLPNLYNYLNQTSSEIWGHEITYFKRNPDVNGIDYSLHEYQLTNITSMQNLKVLVPDNVFPDNQIRFNAFNLDLFESFEIHITRETFKNVFGIEERPGKKDVIYFCQLNRLYEVEHVMHDKTVLNTSTYYKLILKKYTQDASVSWNDDDAKKAIAAITVNTTLDNLFGNTENKDNIDIGKPDQYLPLSKEMITRNLHPKVKVIPYSIYNSSLQIATAAYQMPYRTSDFVVNYGNADNILNTGDNRSFILWFNHSLYSNADTTILFSNLSSGNGYECSITNDVLTLTINSEIYNTGTLNLEADVWYCVLINVDQLQGKISIRILTRQTETDADKLNDSLLVTHSYTKFDHIAQEFNITNNLYMGKVTTALLAPTTSNYMLTNFRVLNQIVPDDLIHKVLNEYIIKDESALIFADNAEAKIILPNYGKN